MYDAFVTVGLPRLQKNLEVHRSQEIYYRRLVEIVLERADKR